MVAVDVLVIVSLIFILLGIVVLKIKLKRFRLSAGVWKLLTLSVEMDSGPDAGRGPGTEPEALPKSEPP
jgi:hypothetical protein